MKEGLGSPRGMC